MNGANRCLVAEETRCNFFVLVNGYCQLGKFNLDDNQYVGNSLNDSTIYLRSDLGESNSLSISLSNLKYENFTHRYPNLHLHGRYTILCLVFEALFQICKFTFHRLS